MIIKETVTRRYNIAEHLRTPKERAAYLEARFEKANGHAALIARRSEALRDPIWPAYLNLLITAVALQWSLTMFRRVMAIGRWAGWCAASQTRVRLWRIDAFPRERRRS